MFFALSLTSPPGKMANLIREKILFGYYNIEEIAMELVLIKASGMKCSDNASKCSYEQANRRRRHKV